MKFDHSPSSHKIQRPEILGCDPFTAFPKLKTWGNAIECQPLLRPLAAHDQELWQSCHASTTGGATTPCTFSWLDAFTCLSELNVTLITGSPCHSVALSKRKIQKKLTDFEHWTLIWELVEVLGVLGTNRWWRTKQVLRKKVQRLPKSL